MTTATASMALVTVKRDLRLTDEELARAIGAGVRTVRRLLSQEERPRRTRHEEQIDDLRTIVEILRNAYSAETTRSWLFARNRLINLTVRLMSSKAGTSIACGKPPRRSLKAITHSVRGSRLMSAFGLRALRL